MPARNKIFIVFLLIIIRIPLFSQGEISDEPRILYRNEKSGSFFLSSNGWGLDYTFGRRINARNQIIYKAEFMNVKHPKEVKISNNYYSNQGFIFGKLNTFFEFKGYFGKQHELFRKNDKGGISVRYYYGLGPVIGVLKPIYYEVLYTRGISNEFYSRIEKFNPSIHQSNIIGRASFFRGFDELSFVPGASLKSGLSFEYSRDDIKLHALEAAVAIDLFPKEIPIMATQHNSFFFLHLIVGYRFGKAIDIGEAARSKTWKERQAEKKLSREIMKDQKKNAEELQNF
jgi:hypothetical protein